MRLELEKFLPLPVRSQNSNKGTFGKILNIAGSENYSGAAILSSLAALKTGAGYVTLACPENIISSAASYTPDITFLPLKTDRNKDYTSENFDIISENIINYDVISIGCGLTNKPYSLILKLTECIKIPAIIYTRVFEILL